ncbi:MAG: succinate dehydrogenase/fumarate reductase cytochrome b subunit [Rikenellaceae bacterium]|nr:succinate dehydrogenase/fumarate reductase cytochrome b subunit [Rikenellaceae bacterium]
MGTFLTNSSIGRKLVMSITGAFLVLFITFHMAMNLVALISTEGYNMICEFLGANWYALVATVILAAGVVVHFVYAFILTFQNRKARGNVRYAVTSGHKGVDWASQNMLVLGIIVIGGLAIHMIHFWSKMQLQEIMGNHENALGYAVTDGSALIAYTFSNPINVIVYLVWFAALWFHLSHGIWSMFQSLGWANQTWYPRLKCLATAWTTLIVLGFAAVAIGFYIKSLGCCAGC